MLHSLQQVAEFRSIFCHQSSICFLGFRLYICPKGSCIMAQCKNSQCLLVLGSYLTLLLSLWCLYGHAAGMELGMCCAGNSTWLVYWSPAQNFWPEEPPFATLPATVERGPTAWHLYPEHTPSVNTKALFASPPVCRVDPISFPVQLPTALCNILCLTVFVP